MTQSTLIKVPSDIFMVFLSIVIVGLAVGVSSYSWFLESSNANQTIMIMEQQNETNILKNKVTELEKKVEELEKKQ